MRWSADLDGCEYVVRMELAPPDSRVLGRAEFHLDGFRILATVSVTEDGRPVASSLHIESGGREGITASTLRAFKISELLAVVADELITARNPRWQAINGMTAERVALLGAVEKPARRRSPNRIPDRTLRQVAQLYLKEQHAGPGMRRRMLAAMKMPPSAEPTVRYWIQRARAEGWLSAAEHGQRAAAAGPRLIEYREQKGTK